MMWNRYGQYLTEFQSYIDQNLVGFITGQNYVANEWEYPVMIGTGIAYEIPANNRDAAEGYSFWAKAGIAF